MSKELYIGVSGKAQRAVNMYVGVGGVARKVRAAYVGDGEGKARLFFGVHWQPGIITPTNMTSNDAPPPYRVGAKSSYGNGLSEYRIFNSSDSLWWSSGSGSIPNGSVTPTGGELWCDIDLAEPRFANRGRLKSYSNQTDGNATFPTSFQILGTNDETLWKENPTSDNWVILADIQGYSYPGASTWAPQFIIDNPGYYRFYRLRIYRVDTYSGRANNAMTIKQFELSAV
jgi:hypothetical protein